ncbi:proline dehydrogenase [Alkalihalophilus pseudofirmus]|nr:MULTISPECIES: proline dehydrogenase [Alkalihalophilus]MDV2885762.1 proline dehydrogenase [Alkalihalophilus pseudofirmus]MED1600917.1 proline dehydrogenase [Alkalihalophilus marmarensis]WEG16065.1 proline dehydrogenase [Alkalihalophilus pseudofirmus]
MVSMVLKPMFLYLSKNKVLNRGAKRWGLKMGAKQVIAGVTINDAMIAVRELNDKGLVATVDHVGEFITTREEALESADYCLQTLKAISETGVKCNLSLKLTQLGLDVERELCYQNMRKIVGKAEELGNFVRIDMEDSAHCQQTLDLLNELREEFPHSVGTVIQAYLYRASQDVTDLQGVNLRLVKGAYKEPSQIAIQDKKEIDDNYLAIIKQHLLSGSYTAIATHDHMIIDKVKTFCAEEGIPKTQFEFQMLYGFRKELQETIAKEGYTMRVYVPYGTDWYGYYMRRLAERPQNVSFVLRGLLSK